MNKNIELTISNTLKDLGIAPNLLGYAYLRHSIKLAIDDMSVVHSLTSKVYPKVARQFNTTPVRVERAIRHAVTCAWNGPKTDIREYIFRDIVKCTGGKPMNVAFIATVADYLILTEEVPHGLK